jgi:hypothetical protein
MYGTQQCNWCGDIGEVELDNESFYSLIHGTPIQEALPTVSKELREQIISGTHPQCWIEMTEGKQQ